MIKYKDAIWKLACYKANQYFGGENMPRAEGAETAAWIFEVSTEKVFSDIENVYLAAKKEVWGPRKA